MSAKTSANDAVRKDGIIVAYKMAASEVIYKGWPVLLNAAGYAFTNDWTTNTLANGDTYLWVCQETMDNSAGAAGDKEVVVVRTGTFIMTIDDTVTQANVWDEVYINNVSDDALITNTSDTGQPQLTIGKIVEFISANSVRVDITKDVVAANGA